MLFDCSSEYEEEHRKARIRQFNGTMADRYSDFAFWPKNHAALKILR